MSNIIKINDAQFDLLYRELVDSNSENFCGEMLRDCQLIEAEIETFNDNDGDSRVSSIIEAVSSLKSAISAEQTRYGDMGQAFKVFHDTVHSNDKEFAKHIDTIYSDMTKAQSIENLEEVINNYLDGNLLIDVFGIVDSFEGLDPNDVFDFLMSIEILQQYNNMPLDQVQQELAKLEDKSLAERLWEIIKEQYWPDGEDPADIVFKIVGVPGRNEIIEALVRRHYKNILCTPTEIETFINKLNTINEKKAARQLDAIQIRRLQKKADKYAKKILDSNKADLSMKTLSKALKAVSLVMLAVESGHEVYEGVYLDGLDWDIAIENAVSDVLIPAGVVAAGTQLTKALIAMIPSVSISVIAVDLISIGGGMLLGAVYEDADLSIPNEIEDRLIIWSWEQETIDESENS